MAADQLHRALLHLVLAVGSVQTLCPGSLQSSVYSSIVTVLSFSSSSSSKSCSTCQSIVYTLALAKAVIVALVFNVSKRINSTTSVKVSTAAGLLPVHSYAVCSARTFTLQKCVCTHASGAIYSTTVTCTTVICMAVTNYAHYAWRQQQLCLSGTLL
jgi:hypothetical protein